MYALTEANSDDIDIYSELRNSEEQISGPDNTREMSRAIAQRLGLDPKKF